MKDNRTELNGKAKFLAGLSSFLEKNKTLLIIILAVIVATIIIVGVIDSVMSKKANEAAAAIEMVQKDYDTWLALADDDEGKTTKKAELTNAIDDFLEGNSSAYATQRALFLKANIIFQGEQWADAAVLFADSAETNKDSYLAPIALMLAASSFENAESYKEALDIYISVYTNYDKIYPDIPRAMLSIGRLHEQTGNKDTAIEAYNELLDKYPGSGWASFARTRIIQLD